MYCKRGSNLQCSDTIYRNKSSNVALLKCGNNGTSLLMTLQICHDLTLLSKPEEKRYTLLFTTIPTLATVSYQAAIRTCIKLEIGDPGCCNAGTFASRHANRRRFPSNSVDIRGRDC